MNTLQRDAIRCRGGSEWISGFNLIVCAVPAYTADAQSLPDWSPATQTVYTLSALFRQNGTIGAIRQAPRLQLVGRAL
jgi:hypothetical protein